MLLESHPFSRFHPFFQTFPLPSFSPSPSTGRVDVRQETKSIGKSVVTEFISTFKKIKEGANVVSQPISKTGLGQTESRKLFNSIWVWRKKEKETKPSGAKLTISRCWQQGETSKQKN